MSEAIRDALRSRSNTPQTEQARPDQVKNNAGGFVFQVSDQTRLERFLILGTDGGTYYVDQKKLTKDAIGFVIDMIASDEELVERVVVEVSASGRSYRNNTAIFVMAALFTFGKRKNKDAFSKVVRTSTHLFEFAEYVQLLGTGKGWGRSKRAAIASWYENKTPDQLAYQAVKYRQRNGWTHRDLLRLSHPVGVDQEVGKFILGKLPEDAEIQVPMIYGFQALQEAGSARDVVDILGNVNAPLPWEAIPTQFLKDTDVWKSLFYHGQLKGQALLRNITRLAKLGAFNDMKFTHEIAVALMDEDMIARTKLHPIQYLLALVVHQEGQVDRSGGYHFGESRNKTWTESPVIVAALNEGFYKAFKYVEPADKRTVLALDVSGSMGSPAMGIDLTCAQVSAAMAMTIMRTEPYYQVYGFANTFRDLGLNPSMELNDVMNKISGLTFGGTDCAAPMRYAYDQSIEVDTFVVITDNETWAGRPHPFQAIRKYRDKTGIDAKLVVVGLTSTGFTIADPSDRGMLDVVGGDANLPSLIANFSAGRI